MTEYITRSSALQAVGDVHPLDYNGQGIVERIKGIPAADVVEMRHGRWERVVDCDKWICSECKEENLYAYSYGDDDYELQDFYCPNCGARMDGGQED